ncbi:MAG: NAD(P)/FAD-dependent oxidoreductase [Oscillospiraceae bacterium]|jgi:glycerol-3-phosphate dehydrogenase|nr:NAD(P)/FAD-dependent oxidoreductase [Oscillospiraceae bacterium]
MVDVLVIGCGVVGAGIACELARLDASVLVVDGENDVCGQTSKANSAIVHAGYDPQPGSLMARYNVLGNSLMPGLCERLGVGYAANGSLVVAFSAQERDHLQTLLARGGQNGVPGLRILTGDEARGLEPALSPDVRWALYAPTGGIVDPWALTIALAETAVRNGAKIRLDTLVRAIAPQGDCYAVDTSKGQVEAHFVVNAAGVYADAVHAMVAPPTFAIAPVKGEYLLLDKAQGTLVHRTVFQCPTAAGKGVLVAPTVHGNLITGPTAEAVTDREDVSTTARGMASVRALAAKSVPGVDFRATIRSFAGLRANNARAHDFVVGFVPGHPRFLDVAAIQSPGLTSAPAIARDVAGMLQAHGLNAPAKSVWIEEPLPTPFRRLSAQEQHALVARDARYGRVICRCESVTEGEIAAAARRPIPPRSLDGVKRRCGAGMGRCQGGFCGPRVLDILAGELGCDPLEIPQDKADSRQLIGRVGEGAWARDV